MGVERVGPRSRLAHTMRRRELLMGTAVAARGMAQGGGKIRIGFLGGSHSHAAAKIRIAMEAADWELAGLWEADGGLAESYRKKGVKLVEKAALLGDAGVQVIAVESDVKTHEGLAMEALRAGKHVHVEKPPSDNWAGMKKLVDEARKRGRLLQMGYMWRQHPGFAKIFEAVRAGWLGDVYMVRGTMNTLIEAQQRKAWAEFHGGTMFELGGHLVDPMVRLMGRPVKVTPFLRHHGKLSDGLLDSTHAVFEWPGAMGTITSAVMQPGAPAQRGFEVWGTNGNAVLRPIEGTPRLAMDLQKAAGPYNKGPQEIVLAKYERYVGGFVELAAAVRSGKALPVTPEEDLQVQEALLRASEMF